MQHQRTELVSVLAKPFLFPEQTEQTNIFRFFQMATYRTGGDLGNAVVF